MIASPFLSASGTLGDGAAPPPPQYIKYLPQGSIKNVWRSEDPYRGKRFRRSGAQKAGLAFQKHVVKWAGERNDLFLEVGPWFAFTDDSDSRHFCQPDLLIRVNGLVLVCEIKLRWTADAWWQLRKIYLPVLEKFWPTSSFAPVCLCKSFDPAVSFPEEIQIRSELEECTTSPFNVVLVR